MKLTVRDIMQFGIFKDAKVIAGEKGIDREVMLANIVSTPNVAKFMKGKELLIASGYTFMNSPDAGVKLIYELAEKDVSALAVRPDAYMDEVPRDMINASNQCDLPLLALPAHIPYMDFMMPIFEAVINNQYATLKNTEQVHNTIVGMILSGRNLTDICTLLSDIVEHSLSVIDKAGVFLTKLDIDDALRDDCKADISRVISYVKSLQHTSSCVISLAQMPDNRYSYAVPLITSTGVDGYVLVWDNGKLFSEYDIALLEQASALIALEVMKLNASFAAEKQLRGELLDYMLSGEVTNAEIAQRWAASVNFVFRRNMQILFFSFKNDSEYAARSLSQIRNMNRAIKTWVQNDISDYFQCSANSVLMTEQNNNLIVLLTYDKASKKNSFCSDISLKKMLDELNSSHKPPVRVSVGIGRPVESIELLRRSLTEAKTAFRIGSAVYKSESVYTFDALGAYAVAYNLKGNEFSCNFVRMNLESIMQYELARGDLLLDTLEAYFANDCNYEKTATVLGIHRNTVVYRIKKIEALTDKSLSNRTHSFNLQLSLILYRSAFPNIFDKKS